MKKYNVGIFYLIFFFLSSLTCEAQFMDKLQKRAEQRVKNRVEQKVEQRVDKAVDTMVDAPEKAVIENKNTKKRKNDGKDRPALDLSLLINPSEDVELQDSYQFSFNVSYIIKDLSSKESSEISYWFGSDPQIFGIEMGHSVNTFIVYDMNQDVMSMFSQKDKSVQVLPFSMLGAIYDNTSSDITNFAFTKTGETKKINGYFCQRYIMSSDNLEGEFWFTKEVDIKIADFSKIFLSMGKTSNQKILDIDPNENGFMIEMKTKDNSTGSVSQMTVKDITKTDKKSITSHYKRL